jgi:nitric oxide reductase subunit C
MPHISRKTLITCCTLAFALAAAAGSIAAPPKPVPDAAKGKAIFAARNCAVCHSMGEVGGCLAPPLDGVGQRRGKTFIQARITDSVKARADFARLYKATELMPHPRLPNKLADDVVAYLLTIPPPPGGFKVSGHKPGPVKSTVSAHSSTPQSIAEGRRLFYSKGCMECHSVLGTGAQLTPPLDGIAKRRDWSFVESRITDAELMRLGVGGEYQEKGTVMPPSNLTASEIRSIADFLMSLPARK